MNNKIFTLILILVITLVADNSILLKDKIITIECDGISFMGPGITVDDAKRFAINDAKRNALEQAGTYLESNITILDHIVTKDEIQTYTSGILKTTVISTKKKVINDVFAIEVKIKARIDTKVLDDRLKNISDDSQLKKTLEEQKKLNDELTKQIMELKKQNKGFQKKSNKIARSLEAGDWFDKGYDSYLQEEYDLAVKYYTKAIKLDPDIAVIYNNRGLVYFAMKEYDKAIKDFNKGIKVNPNLAMIYNNASLVYYDLKNYDDTVKYFTKALKIDPTLEKAYYNRGFAYYKLNDYPKCIQDLKQYLKISTNKAGEDYRVEIFIKKLQSTVKMPSLNGQKISNSVTMLRNIGIDNISEEHEFSDSTDKDAIIKTKPSFGEDANNIDGVILVISDGPKVKYSVMPNLYNVSLSDAKQLIKDANLQVGKIINVTDIDKGFDRVIGQSIQKGKKIEQGTVIDITFNVEAKNNEW